MKPCYSLTTLVGIIACLPTFACAQESSRLYFPSERRWERIEPGKAGWDSKKLKTALMYAKDSKSSGVVILLNGRILAERHWEPVDTSPRYRRMTTGKSAAGHNIEDVASCQKSIVSIMVGIAQEKKLLKLSDRASKYLDKGWSRASARQESQITIRHLLTMTSGLTSTLEYEAPPGSKWRYNTSSYAHCLRIVCKASGKDEATVTKEWITEPLEMTDSRWIPRRASGKNEFGFATTVRDLARFGLMIQNRGKWADKTVIADQSYLKQALSPSQKLNQSYGYLWWLNNPKTGKGRRPIPNAPRDLVGAYGSLARRCYVVPSAGLVVTRLGDEPNDKNEFQTEFWRLLREAAPKTRDRR